MCVQQGSSPDMKRSCAHPTSNESNLRCTTPTTTGMQSTTGRACKLCARTTAEFYNATYVGNTKNVACCMIELYKAMKDPSCGQLLGQDAARRYRWPSRDPSLYLYDSHHLRMTTTCRAERLLHTTAPYYWLAAPGSTNVGKELLRRATPPALLPATSLPCRHCKRTASSFALRTTPTPAKRSVVRVLQTPFCVLLAPIVQHQVYEIPSNAPSCTRAQRTYCVVLQPG